MVITKIGEKVSPKYERNPYERYYKNRQKDSTPNQKIKRFSSMLTKTLSKPKKKFVAQILFGMQAS